MIIASKAAIASTKTELVYRWVLVGTGGDLQTSDSSTASSWTSRTSSFGADDILDVASNGIDQYVAVGGQGKLATSPDGITWTQQTSSFSSTNIRAVAYGSDGYWVAVGDSGKVASSPDGVNWTQETSGETTIMFSVAWGSNLWIFGGGSSLRTATDPTGTWTARTSTISQINTHCIYFAPDQAIWVAGTDSGTTGALASSTNGTSWTARTSSFTASTNTTGFASNGSAIVHGNTLSGAVTVDIQSSTDGTTWTNRTPANSSGNFGGGGASDGAGLLVLAGTRIQTSTNGSTWTDQGAAPINPRGICHSSGTPSIR